jgi:hypothetical protein
MADQLERNTRAPNPDVENDDPLAGLARIIGYERPSGETVTTEGASDSSEFDLEAELMPRARRAACPVHRRAGPDRGR